MFNVHKVEGDKTKVLIEIDVFTLLDLVGGFGATNYVERHTILRRWGVNEDTISQMIEGNHDRYTEAKDAVRSIHRDYMKEE